MFTGFKSSFDHAKFHTFGSLAYVLEPVLQSWNKITRWNPRSKVGACVGKSSEHAGNMSLIFDPITNFVSPQFHIVHDDEFTSALRNRIYLLPPKWSNLFKHYDKVSDNELIIPLWQLLCQMREIKC